MPVQLSLTRTMSVPTAAPLSILPTRHRDIPLVPPDSLVVSEKRLEVEDGVARVDSSQITGLSQRKKWSLLAIFSLAIFVDSERSLVVSPSGRHFMTKHHLAPSLT